VYQTVTRFDFAAATTNGHPKIQSWINEIDLATGQSLTEPVLAKASPLGVAEGCHILKRDGWYYFFTAEGGTQDGHRECVYRSKSPLGPFEPPPEGVNPLIYNADHPDIQNTGHMDLIEGDDGKWVAVFLGVRPVFKASVTKEGGLGMPTHLGRETFMAPMEWEAEGLTLLSERAGWIDEFGQKGESARRLYCRSLLTATELSLGWYHVRVPLRRTYSLTERPGYLALRGSPVRIDVEHSPSILLQKQPGFNLDWETQVEFTPSKPGQEAGTVVWMSKGAHAALGLRGIEGGKTEVVFRKPSADDKFEVSSAVSRVSIHIVAEPSSGEDVRHGRSPRNTRHLFRQGSHAPVRVRIQDPRFKRSSRRWHSPQRRTQAALHGCAPRRLRAGRQRHAMPQLGVFQIRQVGSCRCVG
jgi:beta-xylosidase